MPIAYYIEELLEYIEVISKDLTYTKVPCLRRAECIALHEAAERSGDGAIVRSPTSCATLSQIRTIKDCEQKSHVMGPGERRQLCCLRALRIRNLPIAMPTLMKLLYAITALLTTCVPEKDPLKGDHCTVIGHQ